MNTEVSLDPDYPVVAVAAAKDMVVVGGQDEAVALSASDGEELWRESLADDGSGPYRATSSLVYLETATDSENYEDGEARFFDTGGEIGSLPVDVDDYGFAASSFDIETRRTSSTPTTGCCTTRTSRSSGTFPAC